MKRNTSIAILTVAIIALNLCPAILPTWASAQTEGGFVGLYGDPEGLSPCIDIPQGEAGTIYVVATTGGEMSMGFTAAEFRVEVSHPEGYLFDFIPRADAPVSIGDPMDTTPEDPTDESGVVVAFGSCQTISETAGDRVLIGRIQVANLSGGPTELTVKRRSTPTNPFYAVPLFTQCNDPYFSITPMRRCGSDEFGEAIAFRTLLNDANCTGELPCDAPCALGERFEVEANFDSNRFCPGQTSTLIIRVRNIDSSPQNFQLLIDREVVDLFDAVPPGQVVDIIREYNFDECRFERVVVGVVSTSPVCSESWGAEAVTRINCSAGYCSETICAEVYPQAPEEIDTSRDFDVFVNVGTQERPADGLFGISGRLHFDTSRVKAISFHSVDENGQVLDLGDRALYVADIDADQGFVEFAATRRSPGSGADGSLRIARVRFRYLPEALGCAEFRLDTLRLIKVGGGEPCFTNAGATQACPASTTVWPGDTNNDGRVNEQDIVSVAAFWGQLGPERHGEGCGWIPSEAQLFSVAEATYADASGNGRVGVEEILCIGANWSAVRDQTSEAIPLPQRQPLQMWQAYRQMYEFLLSAGDEEWAGAASAALEELMAQTVPAQSALLQNIPNPFNARTRIQFMLAQPGAVEIIIFDTLGRRVRKLVQADYDVGRHHADWDGLDDLRRPVASGVFYYRAVIGKDTFTRRMVLTK